LLVTVSCERDFVTALVVAEGDCVLAGVAAGARETSTHP
jgi:hypothetical protein